MKMNWMRVLIGGVVAGVLMFFADGLIHSQLLKHHWEQVMASMGRKDEDSPGAMIFFALHDLTKGIAVAWLYAAIRKHFGAGPKTAVLAGLAVWAIMFVIPFIAEVPIHIYSRHMLLAWTIYELVATAAGGLVAGALYKEGSSAAPAA